MKYKRQNILDKMCTKVVLGRWITGMMILAIANTLLCGIGIVLSGRTYHGSRIIKSYKPSTCIVESYQISQTESTFGTSWIPPSCQVGANLACNNSKVITQDLQCTFENCTDTEELDKCQDRMEMDTHHLYWFRGEKRYTDIEYQAKYKKDADNASLPLLILSVIFLVVIWIIPCVLGYIHDHRYTFSTIKPGQASLELAIARKLESPPPPPIVREMDSVPENYQIERVIRG